MVEKGIGLEEEAAQYRMRPAAPSPLVLPAFLAFVGRLVAVVVLAQSGE